MKNLFNHCHGTQNFGFLLKNNKLFCPFLRSMVSSKFPFSKSMQDIDPKFPDPAFDYDYLCDKENFESIKRNITARKNRGDIVKVVSLFNKLKDCKPDENESLKNELKKEAMRLPNNTHPEVLKYGEESQIVKHVGRQPVYNFPVKSFSELTSPYGLFRSEKITNLCGERSYFLTGRLAILESALIKYTLNFLLNKGFKLISVPDILKKNVVQSCGMTTEGKRMQIYYLDEDFYGKDWCLSGTSEIAIANYLMNKSFSLSELPLNFVAVSRCYRAEVSELAEEKGLFRVHQFTKVEMFSVCPSNMSATALETYRSYQETLFSNLGLHFRVLDMAPYELGAQANRKYDVEAWMPGRKIYGEISSCSDCTDFQARRLNIKCDNSFAHTVNGTACAIPRLLLALIETHQMEDGNVIIPEPLQKFTHFKHLISDKENLKKRSLSNIMTHSYKYWDESNTLSQKKKKKAPALNQ